MSSAVRSAPSTRARVDLGVARTRARWVGTATWQGGDSAKPPNCPGSRGSELPSATITKSAAMARPLRVPTVKPASAGAESCATACT